MFNAVYKLTQTAVRFLAVLTVFLGLALPSAAPLLAATSGTLTVIGNPKTFPTSNYSLGESNVPLSIYDFKAKNSDMAVSELTVHLMLTNKNPLLVKRVFLVDHVTKQELASAVLGAPIMTNFYPATFKGLNFVVPANTTKSVDVYVDTNTYDVIGLKPSAHAIYPYILRVDKNNGVNPVVARDLSTGVNVETIIGANNANGSQTAIAYFLRAKLLMSEEVLNSYKVKAAPDQEVGKLKVTNTNNAGGYSTQVRHLNFAISTNIPVATAERKLMVYAGAQNKKLIATKVYPVGASFNGQINFSDLEVVDTTILAGQSEIYTVTLDTSDALIDSFVKVSVPAGGVIWFDGAQAGLRYAALTLPLSMGTVSVGVVAPVSPVVVTKNVSVSEKFVGNPTGVVNQANTKVSSFVITAGKAEDVKISQVTIRDAGFCMGGYLQNVSLRNDANVQLGQVIANPSAVCNSKNEYTYSFVPALHLVAGGQLVVNVFADLKAPFAGAVPLVEVKNVLAVGVVTANDVSAVGINLPLQSVYIATAGSMMLQVVLNEPVSNNYLMGAINQDVGKFKLTASTTEGVNITQLVVSSRFSYAATNTMTNIRLIDQDTGKQVGFAVAAFTDTVNGENASKSNYSHATFNGLNFNVPAGQSKVLVLRVDFTTYQDGGFATTGQVVQPVVLQSIGVNPVVKTVVAVGAASGTNLPVTVSTVGVVQKYPDALGAYANEITLYRAKLVVAWASDTPTGAAAPGAAQTVGKFVITNLANSGNYSATVNYLNLEFATTISAPAGVNATRAVTIYKDSLATAAVATTNFAVNQKPAGVTRIMDASFVDVEIASGSSKTFYATLDTTDASAGKSLSIRMPLNGVVWSDGVTAQITAMNNDLPLVYRTFTY